MALRVPSYWRYHGRPVRILRREDGGLTVQQFDPNAQRWEMKVAYLAPIIGGDPDADELTEEDFDRWIAALQPGSDEAIAWDEVVARSSSLVEGIVETVEPGRLRMRGKWWSAQGRLAPSIRPGDWVQIQITPDGPVITELRPAPRSH